MTSGGWLDPLVAMAMVVTLCLSAVLLVKDARRRSAAHRDVHLFHLAMSVAMLAMLIGVPAGSWGVAAAAGFVVPVAWFAAHALVPTRPAGVSTRLGDIQHAIAALAMVVMTSAIAPVAGFASAAGASAAMSGSRPDSMSGSMSGHVSGFTTGAPASPLWGRILVALVVVCVALDATRSTTRPHRRTTLAADIGMALAMGLMALGAA